MKKVLLLILKRTGASLITIFSISLIIFIGVELFPGDVAETVLGQSATPETVEAFRRELKLDLEPHVRYVAWLKDFVHGDFGTSLANGRPVAEFIGRRFPTPCFSPYHGYDCRAPGDFPGHACRILSQHLFRQIDFHHHPFLYLFSGIFCGLYFDHAFFRSIEYFPKPFDY